MLDKIYHEVKNINDKNHYAVIKLTADQNKNNLELVCILLT